MIELGNFIQLNAIRECWIKYIKRKFKIDVNIIFLLNYNRIYKQ